jgi:glycosyltransferase involved in cell wall biosynthesis
MKSLRVGIDASMLTKLQGGISYYIFYLLDELIRSKKDCHFFLYAPCTKHDLQHFKHYSNVTLREIPYLSYKKVIWRNVILPFYVRKDRIEVYWETIYVFRFLMPRKMKMMVTVYDFVAYLFPETMSSLHALYHKVVTRHALNRADYIFSISEGTKNRLKKMFSVDADEVILPPHKPEIYYRDKTELLPFLLQNSLEYNGYLVTVGTWEPRKNFLFLTQIYLKALQLHGPEKVMPLVIIGGGGWKNEQIQETFQSLQEQYPQSFKVAGYISESELSLYLSGARFYICLSLYEGYGMPIAEARHCRTPVIALDVPEMREAAENDGIFITKENAEKELIELMLRKNSSDSEKLPLALTYPKNTESAQKMAAVLEEIQASL